MSPLPNEDNHVEQRLIEQLVGMGWTHISGDTSVPYLTERENFREVVLLDRLRAALQRLNPDDSGQPWLDEPRLSAAINDLLRVPASKLMEANYAITERLRTGTTVDGLDGGRNVTVRYIDFEHPERNDFLVINQFRVDPPGSTGERGFIIPDLVLFVNGIPLVVIECKSPASTDPIEEAITQLLRYSNQRDWVQDDEGAERLFHTNQLMIATCFQAARVGTICADYQHYHEWKDTSPVPSAQVAEELGEQSLSPQQVLVAGMLRPAHLLDLIRCFMLFKTSGGKMVKIVARYHQFRAVYEAVRRLQTGQTAEQSGGQDQRGGVIWHTQGSGKSLTMMFLVRKMRKLPILRRFKIVIVTDRRDLEAQLSDTATLTGETVYRAYNTQRLKTLLAQTSPDLVFAMVQKYQANGDEESGGEGIDDRAAEVFPLLNASQDILVMVDEAHRSHTSTLHASMMSALPNCARIGFTGTPIVMGDQKHTREIFGDFIDRYTIQQSEEDGATVPILYEGRTTDGQVSDGRSLDALFEDMFIERKPEELEAIKAKYATQGAILEAENLIADKAADMLRHYVKTIMPNGFKAMVVSVSRLAAIRYQAALSQARDVLVQRLETLDSAWVTALAEQYETLDDEMRFLVVAYRQLDMLRRLEFGTVISGNHNDDPAWGAWSDRSRVDSQIERFRRPLSQDSLAFLCVKSMLLTGFDAPCAQVLYLDRKMIGHELLQTVARVNRTAPDKACGYIVDYFGVVQHLREALDAYSADDLRGALTNLADELPRLEARHRRAVDVLTAQGVTDIHDVDASLHALRDVRVRAEFVVKLKQFLESLEIVMPHPQALPFVADAKLLGFINKAAANLYRDGQLNIMGVGRKVRNLIDTYIVSNGINPTIPPISIMDADFEQSASKHRSPRTNAAEWEHALRYQLNKDFNQDPAYYRKLSARLEEILTRLKDQWVELIEALRALSQEVKEGRQSDRTGLDPRTQLPFLGILMEESGISSSDDAAVGRLAAFTIELVEHIRQEIRLVDFWRNLHAQDSLRRWVVKTLDDHDIVPFSSQTKTATSIIDLARALHLRLTT